LDNVKNTKDKKTIGKKKQYGMGTLRIQPFSLHFDPVQLTDGYWLGEKSKMKLSKVVNRHCKGGTTEVICLIASLCSQ